MKDIYDEKYWKDRKFEDKHYFQSLIFLKHYEDIYKRTPFVLDFGCGMGYFVHAFKYFGAESIGYDISDYAVKHPYGMSKGFLFNWNDITDHAKFDLVISYDVLEHVPESELDKTIDDLISLTKDMMILSVCMSGDPNFDKDPTHVTKHTRYWWIHQFKKRGMIEVEVPEHYMFRNQILIFRRGECG